jgi:hypothetical protein
MRIDPVDVMGPTTLVEGHPTDAERLLAARLAARYCDHAPGQNVRMRIVTGGEETEIDVEPLSTDDPRIREWRLGD